MTQNLNQSNTYSSLENPSFSSHKTFLGGKIIISESAQQVINKLPSFSKKILGNNLNQLATQAIPQIGFSAHYIDLMRSVLQLKLSKNNPRKTLQIESAVEIEKPKPLLPSSSSASYRINQYPKTEYKKRILRLHDTDEYIIKNNEISVRDAVDLQTLRVREYTRLMQGGGHNNKFWADVIYGVNSRLGGLLDYQALFLSAIFPIFSTNVMAKNYYGSGFKTSVDKVLRNHAIIIGYPNESDKSLQKQLEPDAYLRNRYIKEYTKKVLHLNTDMIVRIDSDMNIHRFYRNGKYEFIELS